MKPVQSGSRRAVLAACLAVAAAGLGSAARADDAAVQAVWAPKQLRFTYLGFTSKYSCDGLGDRVRRTLLTLGARADLKTTPTGCTEGFGRVSPFPGVAATLNVLQPLGDKPPPAGTQTVSAHWKRVDLAPPGDPVRAAGDCELTEQIKESILPLFTARNVEYSSTCLPNQLQVGGTRLKADVLIADPPAPKAP